MSLSHCPDCAAPIKANKCRCGWSANESRKALPPHQRGCDYCERGSIGTVNGISHCRAHAWDAMDGRKTKVISIGTKADPDFVDKKLQSCGS